MDLQDKVAELEEVNCDPLQLQTGFQPPHVSSERIQKSTRLFLYLKCHHRVAPDSTSIALQLRN